MAERLRIGVMGAGSIGCFVGGKLLAAGDTDVTFIGRDRLKTEIAAHGLSIKDFDRDCVVIPAERVVYDTDVAKIFSTVRSSISPGEPTSTPLSIDASSTSFTPPKHRVRGRRGSTRAHCAPRFAFRTMRTGVCLLLLVALGCGDDPTGTTDARPPADAQDCCHDAVPPDAPPPQDPLIGIGSAELVQGGFQFIEGPVWRADNNMLLFSDIPANTIYRLTSFGTIQVFRADSGNSNGLAEDRKGLLLAAEHGNRRVSRTLAGGQIVDVATSYQGMSLNSPNDIAVAGTGHIYFTDPPYGIDPSDQELPFNGVFRVDPSGNVTAEWEGPLSSRPNGIILSPNERVLYVADTAGPVRAYDIEGVSLANERIFTSDVTNADGMCMDRTGNVFVTTLDGVKAFAPDGRLWGTIAIPEMPSNCTFGDSDYRTMYVTARTGLYRVAMTIPGQPG